MPNNLNPVLGIKTKNRQSSNPRDIVIPSSLNLVDSQNNTQSNPFKSINTNVVTQGKGHSVNNLVEESLKNGSIVIPGPYSGHTEAAQNGVELNGLYRLKQVNDFDIKSPGGMTIVMRVMTILLLVLSSISLQAQFITNELISELDTMQYDDPGDFKSPWRYSRKDNILSRWNYDLEVWEATTVNDSILYVGIGGNDATAIKGSKVKYWRTIDAALAAAAQQDLIYHFTTDTLTINTGSHNWVSIISRGAIVNNGVSTLFSGNPPSGNYVFDFNEYRGRRFVTASTAVTDTAYIYFNCKKCSSIPSNLSKYGTYKVGTLINSTEVNGGQALPQLAEGRQTNIEIGNLYSDYQFQNNALIWTSFGDDVGATNANNSSLNINIKNANVFAKTQNIGIFYSFWTNASGDYNTAMKLNIENTTYKSLYTTTDNNPYSLYATITTTAPNSLGVWNPGQLPDTSQNELRLDNVFSHAPIGLGRSAQKVSIKGRFTRTRAIDVVETLTAKCNVGLNVVCDSSHVVSILNGTSGNGVLTLSGRMQTNRAATGVIYATRDFYIKDAQLYNDGITPCIIANTPITVYVIGDLYMNSDSINSNVTFVDLNWSGKDYIVPSNMAAEESANFTMDRLNNFIPVDVSSGIVEVDLPAGTPSKGDWFVISDSRGNAGTNNITIDFINAGDNYLGASANATIATNGETVEFIYVDSTIGWIKK